MTKYNQEYINELINSGITLNDKETQIAEDYLLDHSEYFYPKGYSVPADVLSRKETKTLASGAVRKAKRR